MSLFDHFYRVKAQSDVLEKVAAEGREAAVTLAKLALWNSAKQRSGYSLTGLMEQALSVWGDSHASGVKTASSMDEALPFAASFASALVVDDMISKQAAAGEVTPLEAVKLAGINAESAFDDLEKIAFGIGDLLGLAKQNPQVAGMMIGAAVGAGIGALNDSEDPRRGAVAGATLGTAVGGLGGQTVHDFRVPR